MKHLTKYLCMAATIGLLTACFSDDSTPLDDVDVNEISVTGLEENYVMTSYVGEHLTINPTIEGYKDSELEYQWLLINEKTGTEDSNGDKIEPVVLGTDKNLDYEVNLAPGNYQIRLYTTVKATGLQLISYASLAIQTEFSQGFYILKETADGNTELDLVTKDFDMAPNLLEATQGEAMTGKPVNLCQNYNMYCINPDNDEMESVTALTVTTDQKGFKVMRTTDLKQIFNKENIIFDPMDANEQVYGINQASYYSIMFTSAGIYMTDADGGFSGPTAGMFGMPEVEMSCSPYYVIDFATNGGGSVWDPESHSLTAFDYNLQASPLIRTDRTGADVTQNQTNYECLHCGFNCINNKSRHVYIMKDVTTGNRYIYLTTLYRRNTYLGSYDQLSGHMATASCYATNGKSATYTYCLDGGKVYACNLSTGNYEEVELQLQGIASGENIVYIANQFWNDAYSQDEPFDYFIVGTQNGQNYKLYFYETIGGVPTGEPVKTVSGTGTVKKVRYMSATFNRYNWMFGNHAFNAND